MRFSHLLHFEFATEKNHSPYDFPVHTHFRETVVGSEVVGGWAATGDRKTQCHRYVKWIIIIIVIVLTLVALSYIISCVFHTPRFHQIVVFFSRRRVATLQAISYFASLISHPGGQWKNSFSWFIFFENVAARSRGHASLSVGDRRPAEMHETAAYQKQLCTDP